MKKRRNGRRGFTLIEVLLVILIIGMLAAVFIGVYGGTRKGARIDTTKLLLKQLENELEKYNMHVGHYPSEDEGGLDALRTQPTFDDEDLADAWRGPYIKETPEDPWNNPIQYELVDNPGDLGLAVPYKLWSYGPDGQDGTDDDIRNWSEEGV